MSDNLWRYRAIRDALIQCYPNEPSGRLAQHLTPLAAFISGIVGSKSSPLPSIATKMAGSGQARKPRQTFVEMARQRAHLGRSVGLDHGIGHFRPLERITACIHRGKYNK
jgi:hypothetical protein